MHKIFLKIENKQKSVQKYIIFRSIVRCVLFDNFWAWRNHDVWVLLLHKVFDYDLAYSAFKFQVFMLHKVYIPGLSFHGHFYILSDNFIKRALICIWKCHCWSNTELYVCSQKMISEKVIYSLKIAIDVKEQN